MSRGAGRWQRAILEALHTQTSVAAGHIFPRDCGRRERFVFRRAAERLAARGLVTLAWERFDLYVTPRQQAPEVSHVGAAALSVSHLQNSGDLSHLAEPPAP